MIEYAKSTLGVWPCVLEIISQKKLDLTALCMALQAGHPGVTGGDAECKLRAIHVSGGSDLTDLGAGWDSDEESAGGPQRGET
jgi:hypothetical protein